MYFFKIDYYFCLGSRKDGKKALTDKASIE